MSDLSPLRAPRRTSAPATGRRGVESTMPDLDPNPFADCDTIVCYGNAKLTDTHRQGDPLHRWRNYRVAGALRATKA